MSSIYSCRREFVRPYFDTMTFVLMIGLSQWHLTTYYVPGDNLPRFLIGHCVHACEILKRYTPDQNQAMHCTISCQTMRQTELELRHLAIRSLSSWNNISENQSCFIAN